VQAITRSKLHVRWRNGNQAKYKRL